jgi:hypothetical protein
VEWNVKSYEAASDVEESQRAGGAWGKTEQKFVPVQGFYLAADILAQELPRVGFRQYQR